MKSNMYSDTTTWNPFKGCLFDCSYCKPSFQAQAKRQKWRCTKCYNFIPHEHPERLNKFPSKGNIIFVAGNGDISFSNKKFTNKIIESVKNYKKDKIFYFQSKRPEYFESFEFPEKVTLVTTLETNRDENYENISKAPKPSNRYEQFLDLNYQNKVVTIEPIMDFDVDEFTKWIININPNYVWIGFNSRPKQIQLPEPSKLKFKKFYNNLIDNNITIKHMNLREEFNDIHKF